MVPTSVAQFDKVRVVRISTALSLAMMLGFSVLSVTRSAWADVAMSPLLALPVLLLWYRVETGRL